MTSLIDPTKPSGPVAYTADVRGNFATAKSEIEALQADISESGVINVKDFGATGEGVIDDTTAINDAMAAAVYAGKPCYMPAGTYLTAGLTYPPGLKSLFGDGRNATIIKRIDNAPTGAYMFSPTNIQGFTIHGLTIGCNAANNAQISAGIVATGCWQLRFYDAAIINATSVSNVYGWGIYLTAGADGVHGASSSIYDSELLAAPMGAV